MADPPEEELEGVAEEVGVAAVSVADGVRPCAVEVIADEERDADGVGDAVGLVQPAVSTHRAMAAHTATSAICFFMKFTSVNEQGY